MIQEFDFVLFFSIQLSSLIDYQNILKRFTKNLESSVEKENTRFGPFIFNKKSQNLYKNDIPVHLTTSEQKLLKCFCKSPNTPF